MKLPILEDTIHNAISDKALSSYFHDSIFIEESLLYWAGCDQLMLSGDNVNNKILSSSDTLLKQQVIFSMMLD